MKNRATPIAVFVLGVALTGCSSPASEPVEQVVSGVARLDGTPLSGISVKIVPHAASCNATAAEVVTGRDGSFSIKRTVQLGKAGVIAQNDTLCLGSGGNGQWDAAWHSTDGPAPRKLVFQCAGDTGAWLCTADGDGMEVPSHGT